MSNNRIILLILMIASIPSLLYGQTDTTIEYSKLDIESNDDFSSFAMLKDDLPEYNVFFTGENHLFRTSNYKLQLKMLKYLYKEAGVRHLILEFGFSRGYLVDQYVQTGDTSVFTILNDYSFEEYSRLYKGLYEFNQSLPEGEKIKVHGVDIERSYTTPIKVLNQLLPADSVPIHDSIVLNIEVLKSFMGYNDSRYREFNRSRDDESKKLEYTYKSYSNYFSNQNTVAAMLANFKKHNEKYRAYIGDNFEMFSRIMSGMEAEVIRQEYEVGNMFHGTIYREQYMYKQVEALLDEYKGAKIYGQFGRCHTATSDQDEWCDFYHFKTLASRLGNSKHPDLNGKVMSIATYYPKHYGEQSHVSFVRDLMTILDIKGPGLTLIKNNGDTTSFGELIGKFDYVIVNNYALDEEGDLDNEEDDEEDDKSSSYGRTFFTEFTGDISYYYYSTKQLNSALENVGFSGYDGLMRTYGGSFTIIEDFWTFARFKFDYLPSTQLMKDDTISLNLGGWSQRFHYGLESSASTRFNVSPYGGFGVSMFKLDLWDGTYSQSSDGLFETTQKNESAYTNWGVFLDAGIDMRYNISIFTIGASLGYQFDMSNKKWRVDGARSDASPSFSHSAPYASISLGLSFGY